MDRNQRIQELQRKNRIKQLKDEMMKVFNNLKYDDFLSISETSRIQRMAISIMDSLDAQNKSERLPIGYDYKRWIKDNLKNLKGESYTELVVYLAWNQETFAIILRTDEIVNNIDYIISMSSIAKNGCNFIITNSKLDIGLCLWRTEYEIISYQW